jgi:hypothetical protein
MLCLLLRNQASSIIPIAIPIATVCRRQAGVRLADGAEARGQGISSSLSVPLCRGHSLVQQGTHRRLLRLSTLNHGSLLVAVVFRGLFAEHPRLCPRLDDLIVGFIEVLL